MRNQIRRGESIPRNPAVAFVAYTEFWTDPRVRREAEILANQGFEVHVISTRSQVHLSADSREKVHLYETPLLIRRGSKFRYLYQYIMFFVLSSLILTMVRMQRRISVVHVHSLPDFQVFCAFPVKCLGGSVILDLHEAFPEILSTRFGIRPSDLLYRMALAAERLSCRFADRVIAANDGIRDAVISRGMPSSHITTVYTPASDSCARATGTRGALDSTISSGPLVVHAGGINRERDLETSITALAIVSQTVRPTLVMIGDGDPGYVDSLLKLAAGLGISRNVKFMGKVSPDIARQWMSESRIGLVTLQANPLTRLAWPTRIVEYAALEKPLLVPSLPAIVRKLGNAARYYEPGNAKSLAREMEYILRHDEESRVLAIRAKETCADINPKRTAAALLDVYRALAAS